MPNCKRPEDEYFIQFSHKYFTTDFSFLEYLLTFGEILSYKVSFKKL